MLFHRLRVVVERHDRDARRLELRNILAKRVILPAGQQDQIGLGRDGRLHREGGAFGIADIGQVVQAREGCGIGGPLSGAPVGPGGFRQGDDAIDRAGAGHGQEILIVKAKQYALGGFFERDGAVAQVGHGDFGRGRKAQAEEDGGARKAAGEKGH